MLLRCEKVIAAFRRPKAHRDNRTNWRNVRRFYSFSRKHFLATKLLSLLGPCAFLVMLYAFFRPYNFDAYGLRTGLFAVFQGNCSQGRTVHMMRLLMSLVRCAHLWDIIWRLEDIYLRAPMYYPQTTKLVITGQLTKPDNGFFCVSFGEIP